jgi:hypothetical protein
MDVALQRGTEHGRQGEGKAHPAEERGRDFPDSQSVGCDFPSQRGAPQRNSIVADPLRRNARPRRAGTRRFSIIKTHLMARFAEGFDQRQRRCSTCCREPVKIQNEWPLYGVRAPAGEVLNDALGSTPAVRSWLRERRESAHLPPCRPSRRRSLHATDSRRSGLAARTGLHAPFAPLAAACEKR